MSNDKRKPWYKRPPVLSVIVAALAIVVSIIIWQWPNPSLPPDFSISVSPMQGSVRQGGTTQTTVSVNGIYGYNYPVSLNSSEQPSGLAIAFIPQSEEAAPGYTSTMTINAGLNVPASDYTIKIIGTGADGKEHICKYTITVQKLPPPPPVEPYMVYGDIGIAAGDVWVWSGADWGLEPPILTDGSYLGGNAPEGNKCYAVTSGAGNGNYIGWGLFLGIFQDHKLVTPHTMDLSGYNSLQFWVKTPVNLKVEIQENNAEGVKSSPCIISNYDWNSNLPHTWQRVTIPKSSFRNVNLTAIFCPFMITGNGSRVTFCIDEVVWVP